MELWVQYLPNFAVLVAVIGLAWAVVYGIRYGVVYLKEKGLYEKAQQYVRSIEQTAALLGIDGQKKKELAMLALMKFAETIKANISMDDLDNMIEAAVQIMNAELGKHLKE